MCYRVIIISISMKTVIYTFVENIISVSLLFFVRQLVKLVCQISILLRNVKATGSFAISQGEAVVKHRVIAKGSSSRPSLVERQSCESCTATVSSLMKVILLRRRLRPLNYTLSQFVSRRGKRTRYSFARESAIGTEQQHES